MKGTCFVIPRREKPSKKKKIFETEPHTQLLLRLEILDHPVSLAITK